MAYQFFAKVHQANRSSSVSPPLSPPQNSSSPPQSASTHARPPRYPPPMVVAPPSSSSTSSVSVAAKFRPQMAKDASFQPPAYPHPIQPGYSTPHPHITIEPVSTAHIPSLTRITGLLLPIRYPNSFYTATITDPVIASVSRVAIYHDHPVAAVLASGALSSSPATATTTGGTDKVIGGIRCRLERHSPITTEVLQTQSDRQKQEPTNLYIQTLHLLSPYRGSGVAASLLNSLLFSSPPTPATAATAARSTYQVSELVKHYNIRTVTAHVHEANEDGLKWYISRGFQLEEGIVENYYRRLKPSGARIVKLVLQWRYSDDSIPMQSPVQAPSETTQFGRKSSEEDEDWEKVEAEDDDDQDEHGVQSFTDSKLFDIEDSASRKRKADEEPQRL
ncbi:hypothetical protein P175DRAFT_0559757 [Aspergillus ochraceoroseus IBT 24754]|uniref:N-acetyltransferase domain-containing protein n=2 Tax=Aspergillus ochraceoroseus TaxID=138278 RepID=A0A2T5LRM2_9EURO|nr:uncharacterized protein P175DRAFT_0559757 [Aspergillus ochraceoroseus IBT 24754]KKK13772.1 hypothetical protein AOCH_004339 [Aspergillus ochraceoroseus]PTU18929.1 hypothetical protein P175DRAFT_0559757 [Aspergillus ochraceoroseus IBT 24754]